jgi:catalase
MNGYGSHTFSMTNHENKQVWVKFHLKTQQGIKNFSREEATKIAGENPDFGQEDLCKSIENKDFPKWKLYIQVMDREQAKEFRWNPFDVTKIWPHSEFPLIEVGVLELNEIPNNYFAHVEQAAFSPSQIVQGIGFSPDKMLQGRIFSYPDAQRYRLGANYHQISVNACPFGYSNYQRDGSMANNTAGDSANYFPNSFDEINAEESYKNPEYEINSNIVGFFDRNENDDDHFTQAGALFAKVMTAEERDRLINNIINHMQGIQGEKREEIINRQLCHFFRANIELGMKIAIGLNISIDANTMNHSK